MRNSWQDESPKLEAYRKAIESGLVLNTSLAIIHAIKQNPKSILWFRDYTGFTHQTVTACLSIIEDDGIIAPCGIEHRINSKTNNEQSYTVYKFVDSAADRVSHRYRRWAIKYKQWQKKGESMGFFRRYKHEPEPQQYKLPLED